MKMRRIALLVLTVIMVVSVCTSCASKPKTTVEISFVGQDNKTIINTFTAEIEGENPTVIDAVTALTDAYATVENYANITISSDKSSVIEVDGYKESLTADSNNMIKYWMFLVNGEEPAGDANDVVVKNGDKIVFQFVQEAVEEK